jgi:predicted DNA-binding protein (MmcQ/YjbR family)
MNTKAQAPSLGARKRKATEVLTQDGVLERLRAICRQLPDVTEAVTFGHPTFKINNKPFAVLETYKGDLSICVNVGQKFHNIFEADPRFYRTPYIGKYGWVSLKVYAAPLNWTEIEALVRQSRELVLYPAKEKRPVRVCTER